MFNTHAVDIAYLKIITAIGEFNPIGEIYIEVPPRTSSNNILTTNGEGRRVMVFCSWGGNIHNLHHLASYLISRNSW